MLREERLKLGSYLLKDERSLKILIQSPLKSGKNRLLTIKVESTNQTIELKQPTPSCI